MHKKMMLQCGSKVHTYIPTDVSDLALSSQSPKTPADYARGSQTSYCRPTKNVLAHAFAEIALLLAVLAAPVDVELDAVEVDAGVFW